MKYKDYYSVQSRRYASTRPHYPRELFEFLVSKVRESRLAWDVGTGNGQAAIPLASSFERVIATDVSAEQIRNAVPHPEVEYRVEASSNSSLDEGSADLITVSTALHWMDHDRFYEEVRRVGKPGAIVAVWTYELPFVEEQFKRFLMDQLPRLFSQYWPEELDYVEKQYRTIPFPFDEMKAPPFSIRTEWTARQYLDFMYTWSSMQRYVKAEQVDPLKPLARRFSALWGAPGTTRTIHWDLHLRIGHI